MGGSGGMGSGGSGITEEMMELLTDMYIRRADTSRNSITCQFNIYDPFNYIGSARFLLWKTSENITDINEVINSDGIVSLSASAADTELTFHDLEPNEDYTIVLGFVNEDGVFEERDRITASTSDYSSSVEITTVRENSYDYVLHLDPEMENIKTVSILFNGDPESWVNDLEFEVMMSERGFVDTRKFEGLSMLTVDKFQIVVNVEFEGNSTPVTVARTTVENPFYTEKTGKNGASAASLSELMEEVSTLRKQVAILSEELGLEEEIAGQDTSTKTQEKTQQSGSQSETVIKPSEDSQDSTVIKTPEESKSDTETKPSGEAQSGTVTRPSTETENADETILKEDKAGEEDKMESPSEEETKVQIVVPEEHKTVKTEQESGAALKLKEVLESEISAFSADKVQEDDENVEPQSAGTEAESGETNADAASQAAE